MKLPFSEEKINKFLNDYYHHLSLTVVVVVLSLGTAFFLWPQYQELHATGILEHKEALALLQQRQSHLQDIENMKQEYNSLNLRAWRNLDYILPKEDDIYLLFAQIEALVESNGYSLTSININKMSGDQTAGKQTKADTKITDSSLTGIKEVKVTINISGVNTYQDFKSFLDKIENNIRILDIDSITYSPGNDSYSLLVSTYYLSKEFEQPGVDSSETQSKQKLMGM